MVVVGETHGTQESPALVADVACHLAENGRVLVGVELPRWLNEDLANFVVGGFDPSTLVTARRAVVLPDGTPLAGSEQQWWQETQDGRSSRAMLGLLTRIRELVGAGREVDALAFDDAALWFEGEDAPEHTRDELMARNVAGPWEEGGYDHALILTGSSHARRSLDGQKRTMVDWLPEAHVFSIHVRFRRGAAWTCRSAREGALPVGCGMFPLPEHSDDGPLLTLTPTLPGHFDAEILLPEATPSEPVGGDEIVPSAIN